MEDMGHFENKSLGVIKNINPSVKTHNERQRPKQWLSDTCLNELLLLTYAAIV